MKEASDMLSDIKLHFNIKHPDFEECYLFGYECALKELDESENPFSANSSEGDQWLEGWWDGFYGKEASLKLDDNATKIEAAANDHNFHESIDSFLIKLLEISSMIAVSAFVGYQLLELVA